MIKGLPSALTLARMLGRMTKKGGAYPPIDSQKMASAFSQIGRKIFGSKNDREVKRLRPSVDEINGLEPEFEKLSDDELRAKMAEWKATLSAIEERERQTEVMQD